MKTWIIQLMVLLVVSSLYAEVSWQQIDDFESYDLGDVSTNTGGAWSDDNTYISIKEESLGGSRFIEMGRG